MVASVKAGYAAFIGLMKRDLLLAFRHRSELLNPIFFFMMIVSLFPLGVSPDDGMLSAMAPGVIWIAALLSALFSLETMFRSDYDDGALEQMLLSPQPLVLLVLAKIAAHWLVTGVPMLLMAPILALLFALNPEAIITLELTLLIGTPLLSLIGSVGVALTVGLRKGGVLLTLLVLPLFIPVLIFASNAVTESAVGMPVDGQIYFLLALLILALTLAPIATAFGLRISLS